MQVDVSHRATCGVKACTAVARGENASAAVAPMESPSISTLL